MVVVEGEEGDREQERQSPGVCAQDVADVAMEFWRCEAEEGVGEVRCDG